MTGAATESSAGTGAVLAVFAHPDDAEICAGGTLAKWAAAGRQVHLRILTNGDRGSNDASRGRADLAAARVGETQAAAEVLGLASARVGEVPDGELENTSVVRSSVVRAIRELRPETLVSCDPTAVFFDKRYYNHADHRAAGWIALDAVFPGAGNPHFFAEQLAEGLEAWQVNDVWLGWTLEPNHREDIGETLQRKIDALSRHRSQTEGGMLGYFEQWLEEEARDEGEKAGVRYAEAFRRLALD